MSIVFVINVHLFSRAWTVLNPNSVQFKILTFFDVILHVAVPLYAMCSGAIFLNREDSIKKIIFKYIFRIYLIFVLFASIYKAIDAIFYNNANLTTTLLFNVLKDSIMLKSIYHLWYLRVVMVIYTLIPIFKLLQKIKIKYIDFIILGILLVLFKGLPLFIENEFFLKASSTFGYSIYFYMGYMLDKKKKNNLDFLLIIPSVLCYLIIFSKTISLSIKLNTPSLYYFDYLSFYIMIISASIFIFIKNREKVFNTYKIKKLLDIESMHNFYIYLVHGLTIGFYSYLGLFDLYKYKNPLIIFGLSILVYLTSYILSIPLILVKAFIFKSEKYIIYIKKIINLTNAFIKKNIEKLLIVFLFSQPILDVITSLEINIIHTDFSIGSITRFLFLLLMCYYILFINKEKIYKIITVTIFSYLFVFITSILYFKDFDALLYEVRNALNTFYFPLTLIAFNIICGEKRFNLNIKKLVLIYFIYIALILIPNIFNVGFNSYYESKTGSIGWFYSANSIGNILCFLLPLVLYFIIKYKTNIIIKLIALLSIIYVFLSIGTKVPIFGLIICTTILSLYFLIYWLKQKKYKYIILSSTIAFVVIISAIIIIPKSSFYKNIEIHKKYLGFNHYYEVFTKKELIDHFIFSQRLTFLKNTHNNFNKSKPLEKIVGIGYIENYGSDDVSIKTIEIDYLDVAYRHGIIGGLIFYITTIPFIIKFIKTRNESSILNLSFKTSIILLLLLALFSGHILTSPNVCIFVVIVISVFIHKNTYNVFKL